MHPHVFTATLALWLASHVAPSACVRRRHCAAQMRYTAPCASTASATLMKLATLAPAVHARLKEMSAVVGLWARLPASALVQPTTQHPNKAAGSPPLARETPYSSAACLDVL